MQAEWKTATSKKHRNPGESVRGSRNPSMVEDIDANIKSSFIFKNGVRQKEAQDSCKHAESAPVTGEDGGGPSRCKEPAILTLCLGIFQDHLLIRVPRNSSAGISIPKEEDSSVYSIQSCVAQKFALRPATSTLTSMRIYKSHLPTLFLYPYVPAYSYSCPGGS